MYFFFLQKSLCGRLSIYSQDEVILKFGWYHCCCHPERYDHFFKGKLSGAKQLWAESQDCLQMCSARQLWLQILTSKWKAGWNKHEK